MAQSPKIMVGKHELDQSHIVKAANYLHVKSISANVKGMPLALKNILSLQLNTQAVEKQTEKYNIFLKTLYLLYQIFLAWIFRTYGKLTCPLLRLLESIHMFGATDPKDRIYGLLGLANKGDIIRVNYNKKVQDVYTEATQEILCIFWRGNLMYGLCVLASVQQEKVDLDNPWPLWVQKQQNTDKQDLDKKQALAFQTSIINNLPSLAGFCTRGNSYLTPKSTLPFDLYSVLVKGFIFDRIIKNVHYMEPMPLLRPHLWELVEVIQSIRKIGMLYT